MFRPLILSALAAAVLIPTLAGAEASCQARRTDDRILGTLLGAGLGALLGDVVAQHGGKEGGAIIGGVGGAAAGYAIAGSGDHCPRAAAANPYGYYDDNGRWVPNRGTDDGYYDQNGRWVQTAVPAPPPADGAAQGAAWNAADPWAGAPEDTRDREGRLEAWIQRRLADRALDDRLARRALRDLDDIRRIDADYRAADGRLTPDQRRDILDRLGALRARVGLAT
jgi:hypothetical protein